MTSASQTLSASNSRPRRSPCQKLRPELLQPLNWTIGLLVKPIGAVKRSGADMNSSHQVIINLIMNCCRQPLSIEQPPLNYLNQPMISGHGRARGNNNSGNWPDTNLLLAAAWVMENSWNSLVGIWVAHEVGSRHEIRDLLAGLVG